MVKQKSVYSKEYTKRMKASGVCDVYDVLNMFEVTDPMAQHAIKKLLVTGSRNGNKSYEHDLKDVLWSIKELIKERV